MQSTAPKSSQEYANHIIAQDKAWHKLFWIMIGMVLANAVLIVCGLAVATSVQPSQKFVVVGVAVTVLAVFNLFGAVLGFVLVMVLKPNLPPVEIAKT